MSLRKLEKIVHAHEVTEGAGLKVNRLLGTPELQDLDPFLLLDEFKNEDPAQYIAGFPDHPHRGIETVTYLIAGGMRHEDNKGNSGLLGPGDVQWMTAGRGIIHSEMPDQDKGMLWGLQLWVNLSAKNKMIEPRYQEIKSEEVPVIMGDNGAKLKIIAGQLDGARGPIEKTDVAVVFIDIELPKDTSFNYKISDSYSTFLYVLEGAVCVDDGANKQNLSKGQLGIFGLGNSIKLDSTKSSGRALLAAGQPHREPIVKYGPFVMNTKEQIAEAIDDFREGRF